MSVSIEDLVVRLQTLEDKEAIRLLKSRYLRACDLKQPEAVRAASCLQAYASTIRAFPCSLTATLSSPCTRAWRAGAAFTTFIMPPTGTSN